MNAKTPVSILQEMMVKKGTVPNYDLIHDGGGTHINTFTYRVMCDGFVATGTGRCKKDAKHTAAKNMLDEIIQARSCPQLPATPCDSPVRTPLPETLPPSPKISANEPFLNAIGELKDLCAENELQEPEYRMISDVGPPHARIFTYHCVVSTFKEEGRAMTKKQAKHEASRKMLERLIDVVTDLKDKDSVYGYLLRCKDPMETDISAERAKTLYNDLTKLPAKRAHLGLRIMDYHVKLRNTFNDDTIPTRDEVLTNLSKVIRHVDDCEQSLSPDTIDTIKRTINDFLEPLLMSMCSAVYASDNDDEKMIIVKINSTPDIAEIKIGDDVVDMEYRAIKKVLNTFQLFME